MRKISASSPTANWSAVLDFLWPWHPFRLVYDAAGDSVAREGLHILQASPWILSTDPAVGGTLAIPWERLVRTVSDATFTRVEYHWRFDLPAEESGNAVTYVDWVGVATSQSLVNPHRVTPPPHVSIITDRTPYHAAGTVSPPVILGLSVYAQYLLDQELRQRDVVTLEVDSACPVPELGEIVRLCDPPRVDGVYQLVGISQPLDEGPATWTLGWVRDGAVS